MSCQTPCATDEDGPPAVPLVGAIVVNAHDVGFYVFEANSRNLIKRHKTPLENVALTRDGWEEQDPGAVLSAVDECVAATMTAQGLLFGDAVVAVGVANERGSVLAWDRETGRPLSNVVLWSDNRAAALVAKYLSSDGRHKFHAVNGLPFSTRFSAFKIKWLLDNDAAVRQAHEDGRCCFGTLDSWVVWNLTGGQEGGVFATDSTNAASTFLMNINTWKWDDGLLKFFGISARSLPEIKPTSSEVYGKIKKGLCKDIPITGVVGNRQANMIGYKCLQRGLTNVTLDANGSVLYITGEEKMFSKNGLLTTIGYHLDTKPIYALEGSLYPAGRSSSWGKQYSPIKPPCKLYKSKDKAARNLDLVPALNTVNTGLFTSNWNNETLGTICGMPYETKKIDIIKAAVKSTPLQIQDVLEAIDKDLKDPTTIKKLKVSGELSKNKDTMQLLADITDKQVEATDYEYMTALGAAIVPGHAAGVTGAVCMPDHKTVSYKPSMLEENRLRKKKRWNRAKSAKFLEAKSESSTNKWTWWAPVLGVVSILAYVFMRK